MAELDDDLAARLTGIALGHVEREYPNKLDHVLERAEDARTPRELHPIFFGSFDWHSCVHGYWTIARALRRRPDHPAAAAARALLGARLTPEAAAGELAYLARPSARGFERPYGWAWMLALQRELEALEEGRYAAPTRPLAEAFAERFRQFLPIATYPVRTGAHSSSAFALRLALAWADAHAPGFAVLLSEKARAWFGHDRDARPFEPSGEDFLSPTLMEAALMRAVLDTAAFEAWLAGFLPGLAAGEPEALFEPAGVSDRSDGKIAHLDGLNLSRAWCFSALAAGRPGAERLEAAARRHLAAGLPHVAGDYMGEHWLASFALLAVDGL